MERGHIGLLSDREKQLLELASQGLIDTAIATKLGISEATVSTYWGRIRIKIGPYSRTELVAIVLKEQGENAMAALKKENEELTRRLRVEGGSYNSDSSFYRDLLAIAADAMLIVNPAGIIENANDSASELFGYDHSELVGNRVSTLMPERYRVVHDQHRKDYIEHPEKKRMGEHHLTLALHKSGKEFSIAATLSALNFGGGVAVLCVVRPVTIN